MALSLCVCGGGGVKRWGSLNAFMATLVSRLHVCSWFVWFEAVNQTRPGPSVCVGGVDADARSRGPRDETRVHQDPEHSWERGQRQTLGNKLSTCNVYDHTTSLSLSPSLFRSSSLSPLHIHYLYFSHFTILAPQHTHSYSHKRVCERARAQSVCALLTAM